MKPSQHKDFAERHGMHSFFVSAKTGDNVAASFHRIAADLCDVTLTKPELQAVSKVVPAAIIDHEKDDPTILAPPLGGGLAADASVAAAGSGGRHGSSKKNCAIQ
ncbi:hypothetical protein EON66_02595 [archaeon]|nr:MAG: hypothetical protein EON66_02595 [archaeon]